jgi:hypothetical protein
MRVLTFAGFSLCVGMMTRQTASLEATDSAVHFPTAPTVIHLRGHGNTPELMRGDLWVKIAFLHVVLVVVALAIVLIFRRGDKDAGLPRVDAKFAEETPAPKKFVGGADPLNGPRLLDPDLHIREVAKKLAEEATQRDLARSQRRNPLSRAHPRMFYIGDSDDSVASTPKEPSSVWGGRAFPTLAAA